MQAFILASLVGAAFALGFFFQLILDKLLRLCIVVAALFVAVVALVHVNQYAKAAGFDVTALFADYVLPHLKFDWQKFAWDADI